MKFAEKKMYHYTLKKDPYSSHQIIATLIARRGPNGRILDVGCGRGFLPLALGEHFQGQIIGLDKNQEIIRETKHLYAESHCVDVTDQKQFPIKGVFDVIVFADILEHLAEPALAVKRLLKYLKPGGTVVVSVPNVANWFIRGKLLLGNFDYADRGVLDRTHLRFFTKKTIREFISETGLEIIDEYATPIPLPLMFPQTNVGRWLFFLHQLNASITRWYPSLLAYQFLYVCRSAT